MITSAHIIIYSTNAEADRAFFRDVLKYPNVDAGGGWLIFKLPPTELAIHPDKANDRHELHFVCDDIEGTLRDLKEKGVAHSAVTDQGWGWMSSFTLPGGGNVGIYQPKHLVVTG